MLLHRHFSLSSHFQDFLVGIGMLVRNIGGAGSRSVLGKQSARLVANATSVAQSFGAQRTCPPLWCFLRLAMCASQHFSSFSSILPPLPGCPFRALLCFVKVAGLPLLPFLYSVFFFIVIFFFVFFVFSCTPFGWSCCCRFSL